MKARYIDNTIVSKGASQAGWLFGDPVIRYENNGKGGWCKQNSLSQWQKGGGWTANLYGGVQTGDDWAGVYIPVNELPVPQFTTAQWSYLMSATETMGVNIVIWIHDPDDFDKRVEVTQVGGATGLEKTSGWNAHEFDSSVTQMFFYGENTTGTGLTAGTQYTWAQFQADALFKDWVIYRISFEYGWDASGTFDDAWLAEVKLNGMYIQLTPQPGELIGAELQSVYKATASDSTTAVAIITPAATKRVRIYSVFMSTSSATGSQFELYFHTGANITTDTTKAIATAWLDTDGLGTVTAPFLVPGLCGGIGEVVSMRTSVNISASGSFIVIYGLE